MIAWVVFCCLVRELHRGEGLRIESMMLGIIAMKRPLRGLPQTTSDYHHLLIRQADRPSCSKPYG